MKSKLLITLLLSVMVISSCGSSTRNNSGKAENEGKETTSMLKKQEAKIKHDSIYFRQNPISIHSGDILVEGQHVIPMYLQKGTELVMNYASDMEINLKFYNQDSRTLLRTYTLQSDTDTITIKNSAIYLFELNSNKPQYCNLSLQHFVNNDEEYNNHPTFNCEKIPAEATSFRAKKVQSIVMKPIFEEPHKITIRAKLKNFLDTSSPYRTIAAVKVPAGTTDILYHLRISTNDDGSNADGKFFNDVNTKYKEVRFLGLPLYESTTTQSNLFRELMNGLTVQREENAYCDLVVFTKADQAKKYQANAVLSSLSYDIDNSASGTQSRNERIPVKGIQTVYLGFENTRQTKDIYLWLEAIAAIPTELYYTDKYTVAE